jgi:L-rhamnose mutarotase
MSEYKRYCKTLELENDPALIEAYKKVHAPGAAWPEISQGMREVGITDMEIYISWKQALHDYGNCSDFDHDNAMKELSQKPRQQEWETYVSQFQKTSSDAAAADKWQLMERIYKMD